MKRTVFKYFNLLMACIVLLSSTGFGLIEHTCLMWGKRVSMTINQDDKKSACAVHSKKSFSVSHQVYPGPTIKKTDCCKEEQRYENVDFSSSITQLVAKFIKSVADAALTGLASVITWLLPDFFPASQESSAALIDSPPLPYGRSLLLFVQRFLL